MRTSSRALVLGVLFFAVQAIAQTLAIDAQKSTMTVHVYKTGMFSALGHDHEIQAPIESGEIDKTARTVKLAVDARKLKVVDPDLAPDKRAEVQKEMHSDHVLDSERFHEIRFVSTGAASNGNGTIDVRGQLTIHGQTQPVAVEVHDIDGQYTGRSKFKLTSFGIKPPSAAGGTVKSKDEVMVEFQIVTATSK
jgi:polyisoprenoid-binding protein YceI